MDFDDLFSGYSLIQLHMLKGIRSLMHQVTGVATIIVVCSSCFNGEKSKQGDGSQDKGYIMVFAAASLSDVMNELSDTYELQYKVDVRLNLASSGTLARQISQGETPDLFISASKKWASYVDSMGVFNDTLVEDVATNKLVLITQKENVLKSFSISDGDKLTEVLKEERLSLGDPLHVPAGKYAKQALIYYNCYEQIKDRLLPAKDVRSALMMVELGEVPLGIVYKTDALKSSKVKIIETLSDVSHDSIIYIGGVCVLNNENDRFFKWITSYESNKIWEKYGFNR